MLGLSGEEGTEGGSNPDTGLSQGETRCLGRGKGPGWAARDWKAVGRASARMGWHRPGTSCSWACSVHYSAVVVTVAVEVATGSQPWHKGHIW